jgi:hypothetical protein
MSIDALPLVPRVQPVGQPTLLPGAALSPSEARPTAKQASAEE